MCMVKCTRKGCMTNRSLHAHSYSSSRLIIISNFLDHLIIVKPSAIILCDSYTVDSHNNSDVLLTVCIIIVRDAQQLHLQ